MIPVQGNVGQSVDEGRWVEARSRGQDRIPVVVRGPDGEPMYECDACTWCMRMAGHHPDCPKGGYRDALCDMELERAVGPLAWLRRVLGLPECP